MTKNIKSAFTLIFILLGINCAKAQDKDNLGTEVVNVVKPYTPEIGDAFKVKATPRLSDSVNTTKKKVTYGIFSVPVASTFTPAKGQAAPVEKSKPVKLYDNYTTLAFGTYNSALAEFYTNFEIDRNSNFGIFLTHNSSQGGIEGIVLDDEFYDTELNLNYSARNRNSIWRTDLDLTHKLYNWYGVDDFTANNQAFLQQIDPGHSFYGAGFSTALELNNSFFEGGHASIRYFGDSYKSSEIRGIVEPSFEIPITDQTISLDLKLDYVDGGFERNYLNSQEINYSHLNVSFNPSLRVLKDDLSLDLGVTGALNLDTKNNETTLYLYPSISGSYRVVDEYFIAYAGVEGALKQNSYRDLALENPFVSPTIDSISPTNQKYDAYVGIKGKLSGNLSYNLRGSYIAQDNRLLYKNNPRYDDGMGSLGNEDYQFGNSFGLVNDDLRTISAFGELNFDMNANLKIRINGEVFSYETTNEAEAWNLPDFQASFFTDYQIDENWFAGASLFYVGERKDQQNVLGPFITPIPQTVTLDSFFDANAHAGYRLNDQLSFFGRVNNILGNSYERWLNFPVQGLQVLAGATYKFDF